MKEIYLDHTSSVHDIANVMEALRMGILKEEDLPLETRQYLSAVRERLEKEEPSA